MAVATLARVATPWLAAVRSGEILPVDSSQIEPYFEVTILNS